MRSTKKTAGIADETITEIQKCKNFSKELVAEICKKNKINESFIWMITGWRKDTSRKKKLTPWDIAYEKLSEHYSKAQIDEMTLGELEEIFSYDS